MIKINDHLFSDIRKRADIGTPEPVAPGYKSSEEWVSKFDGWCAENGVTPTITGTSVFAAPPAEDTIASALASLESKIAAGMTKQQLAESLQALNRVNAKLLAVAKKAAEPQ